MPAASLPNGVSTAAEDIFFAHPEFTAADWKQWLGRQRLGQEISSQEVLEELGSLIGHLEHVAKTAEAGAGSEADGAVLQSLRVSGRQGSSYELLDHLGAGGHSVVYRSLQCEPFERLVAIKVYYRSAHSLTAIANLRELRAIARLQHPGVCQVLDAGITPWRQPFLALELVEGSPVNEHLVATSAPLEERLRLFADILETVVHAHSQGVVHRDLKPQNVLVHAASGRVKLIDFSISGISDPEAAPSTGPTTAGYGTPAYRSPEQAGLIRHAIDARSDIYSLGCVLFEMLTGERAFGRDPADSSHTKGFLASRDEQAGRLSGQLAQFLSRQSPAVPASHAAALASIVQRCVARQPVDRFQTADELQQHIAALRAGQPLLLASRVPHPRRVRTVAIPAAAAMIAVMAAGAVTLRRPPEAAVPSPAGVAAAAEAAPAGPVAAAESLLAMLATETRDTWQARVNVTFAELSPDERLNTALRLAPLTIEQGLVDACRMVTEAVATGQGGSDDDLRRRAELMMYRLDARLVGDDMTAARAVAEPLVEQLQQRDLLLTTREGLDLLNRLAGLLVASTAPEDQTRAAALLEPVLADPDRPIDIDSGLAGTLILTGMSLELLQDQPQKALRLADVFETRLLAKAEPATASRWASLSFQAFLALGRFEDASSAISMMVAGPRSLAWAESGKLLLAASTFLEKRHRLDEALAILCRFELPQEPVDPDGAAMGFHLRMKRASLLLKLGRQADALPMLLQAKQIAGQWPDALPHDAAFTVWRFRGLAGPAVGTVSAGQAGYRTALDEMEERAATGDAVAVLLVDRLKTYNADLPINAARL